MIILITPAFGDKTLIRVLDYKLSREKTGATLISGLWLTVDPDWGGAATSLGNSLYSGSFYSKVLPRRLCTSQEEEWADRCDRMEVANQFVFFLDPGENNKPFLILKGFNPLVMPSRGTGRVLGRNVKMVVPNVIEMVASSDTSQWADKIDFGDALNSVTWDASTYQPHWKTLDE